ncbi:MAG: peptidoglycan-binding domain-containing protein [bacterium]|nr:peptidoglycan-binding domain-containing protein [bacterium]
MMTFTKNLRHMATGADVKHMKDALVALGYLQKSTHSLFGDDTLAAVRAYQRTHRDTEGRPLAVDGVIGRKTWAAIERDRAALDGEQAGEKPEPGEGAPDLPENIGPAAAAAIGAALRGVSGERQALVRRALAFAYDPEVPAAYPHSLYIRGGNLYNTDLGINTITRARIEAGAKRQPEYYSGGSRDMMLRAVEQRPGITGADCSGGIVGLLRHFRFTAPGFDATANSLCANGHSAAIGRDDLRPGDWVGRDGHIGLYVGGGYVVEWMGKLYGCQLSKLDNRRGYDFVGRRMRGRGGWTKFRRPKYY